MTVAELIAELQAMPNQGARVCVEVDTSGPEDFGPVCWPVDITEARHEGPYVSLRTHP